MFNMQDSNKVSVQVSNKIKVSLKILAIFI